jgi:predicted transcriptional regulator of viral defense system
VVKVGLRPVFSLEEARRAGVSKDRIYRLLASGEVERVGRGVFFRPEALDPAFVSLAGASVVRGEATLCLTSALAHHGLSDVIPFGADIALPRGTRRPAGFDHVTWHSFAAATFEVGRDKLTIPGESTEEGMSVAIYSAERTLVDTFRLMHQEGSEVGYEALRRWLGRRGSSPAALLRVAADFPKAEPRLRLALQVLL